MPDLTATYTAPDSAEEKWELPLPSIAKDKDVTTEERTEYLGKLRTSITEMQDCINVFLTNKMEEDNAKAGADAVKDDAKEEENYGEEVGEED